MEARPAQPASGRVERELRALGPPVWHQRPDRESIEQLPALEPLLVLVDAGEGPAPLRRLLTALDALRETGGFPVFLVLEPGRVAPSLPADGCLVKARGMTRQIRMVLQTLPAWQALRRERRRKLARLQRLKEENRRLRTLVVRDDLTQLYNLRFFTRSLENEHARATRFGRQYSLVFIDLDGLKDVNTRFGHLAGSRVLKTIGKGGRAAPTLASDSDRPTTAAPRLLQRAQRRGAHRRGRVRHHLSGNAARRGARPR